MKALSAEMIDLVLTQALERYMEMEFDAASAMINAEWPQQMAALLTEFFKRLKCPDCGAHAQYICTLRNNRHTTYITRCCHCSAPRPQSDHH